MSHNPTPLIDYKTGCAIWAFREWVGTFYPPKTKPSDFLPLYCQRLTAVEGNTTFYAVPNTDTLQRWAETMPDGFLFCPKVPRKLTHEGHLQPFTSEALRFAEHMKLLGPNLGPFLLQLPPSYTPDSIVDLGWFLKAWPRHELPITVEVRHPAWFDEPYRTRLNTMLRRANVGRAILDTRPIYNCPDDPQEGRTMRKPRLPVFPDNTAQHVFVRFISHPNTDWNTPYLSQWIDWIQEWTLLNPNLKLFFFAHCPNDFFSPQLAWDFHSLLRERNVPVPDLPWHNLPPTPQQPSLFGDTP